MILRRVIEHFRKQEWTAIAIDFLIVVMGVFIGIQVANWNAVRRDRADERLYLEQLHEDISTADALSVRVRARRLDKQQWLMDAAATLTSGDVNAELTSDQCTGIATSIYYNINAAKLPALTELISAGRLSIIRDPELRGELVAFQQARDSLDFYISYQAIGVEDLASKYPELIKLEPYYDEDLQEMQTYQACDLNAMRTNQAFINDLAQNIDRYDGYVRDGLRPWSEQLEKVHALLDAALAINHGEIVE